ncbi:serine hydrolase [Alkalihalophilus pseudofirmus]|uniref:serine hydrolase domain-containing protein n=1 Tax=Alkalihalophilus pseudofirmus TaxID=79885 RepID=UPI00259B068E|nr:serine hydrolase [Alkalihalophilus pseudofirmus]WEG15127.1 serine hydrolase [Alkalihalophilus pseudofirmus]
MNQIHKALVYTFLPLLLAGCIEANTSSLPASEDFPAEAVRTQIDKERDYYPTENWQTKSPAVLGLNEEVLKELTDEVRHEDVYSMLLIKDGYLAEEYYKSIAFDNSRTPINSVAKSITSSLIGIAIEQGHIEGINQKASDFIPEILDQEDTRKQNWTIEHFLTMTDGLDWPETTSWNEIMVPLESSENWVEFILSRELAYEPGMKFNYNTGSSHLLSVIIERASGQSTKQFANEHLFSQLGIGTMDYFWDIDSNGYYTGGYKMEMAPADLAKIGYLFLNGGRWEGDQLIPQEWVETSTAYHTMTELNTAGFGDYGYQWWVKTLHLDTGELIHSYYGSGAFGQKLIVIPHFDIVAVFTSNLPNESYGLYFEQITEQFLLKLFEG